ncbi:hypothetical protein [Salinibacterium sp. ZJ77]|uniref:hypothetical protein n=1 Tax=Salinibacterium sp. ZJ77 TaxID=2708337 RepID=UPI0014209069|nr:hypothetical protein [Salinibacterium sp. ZJ77]
MFKKAVATVVACLIAIGLSVTASAPAIAGGHPGGGDGPKVSVCHGKPGNGGMYELARTDASGVLGEDPRRGDSAHASHENDIIPPFEGFEGRNLDTVPAGVSVDAFVAAGCAVPVSASVSTTPATCATGELAGKPSAGDPACASQNPTLYGAAFYVYEKTDPKKPASWQNSGLQTLVMAEYSRTSKQANTWFSTLDASSLPAFVCGPGWGVQQDKVQYTGTFTFPTNIQYPVDSIGFPPLYDHTHEELGAYITVPPCPPATAEVVVTPATCDAPASAALGAIQYATFGSLTGATGPGWYKVTAKADTGHTFADGTTTTTLTGKLDAKLSKKHPSCAPPPPPPCIRSSAVSYTYDPATNSGVITVPAAAAGATLCTPFSVTAAAWRYLGDGRWPQKLDNTQKLGLISAPGDYPFSAPVTCGQGDIYASFTANDPTLDPTEYLYAPDSPFDEKFLHDMGFRGPKPTYVVQPPGCNEVSGVTPTQTQATCELGATYTLPAVEHVAWTVDGVSTGPGTYDAVPGAVVRIVAAAEAGWTFPGGKTDKKTSLWTKEWSFHFTAPTGDCATIAGSTAVGECVNDVAWITYTVVLADPYGDATSREAKLMLSGAGGETVTLDLGTIPESGTLTGKVLWPGASVDPVTGEPTGWPGWVQVDGVWQPTSNPAFFGWTRSVTSATIQVNPELVVALSYPPATPHCDDTPPEDLDTLGVFPTNAQLSEQCTADGRAILTLGLVEGVSFFEDVDYVVDGVPATSATVRLAPGVHVVTVSPKSPRDGLEGATRWQVTVTGGQQCGELATLALTGAEVSPVLTAAALLGLLGLGGVAASRIRMRRIR